MKHNNSGNATVTDNCTEMTISDTYSEEIAEGRNNIEIEKNYKYNETEESTSYKRNLKYKRRGLSTYVINIQFVLALQSFGLGCNAARQFILTLGLLLNVYSFDAFTKMEEEISLHKISPSEDIIAEIRP